MPESLIIRINAESDDAHSWAVVDDSGTRIGETRFGRLSEAANEAQQRTVIALIPSSKCLVTHSDLPLKSAQKLLQALPFSFEDQMIGDVSATHFAFGARNSDGLFPVVAVDTALFKEHLLALRDAGLHINSVYPEDSVVPLTPGGCTVLLEDGYGIMRSESGDAVTLDYDSIVDGLLLATADSEDEDDNDNEGEAAPIPITIFIDDGSGAEGEQCINVIHERFPHSEFRRLPHGALSKLATEAIQPGHPNLLQGEFAPSTSLEKLIGPWRGAGIAAALFATLFIAYKAVELSSLNSQIVQANAAMLELARNTFPQIEAIPDPVKLFRQKGGSGPDLGGSPFLEYMEIVSAATASNNLLTVNRLVYRTGTLDLEVDAPNVQSLDSFANKIGSSDQWSASLQSTKAVGSSVQGRLSVSKSESP